MKLQINVSGAWRNVVEFEPGKTREVERAAEILAKNCEGTWRHVDHFDTARYYYGTPGRWLTLEEKRGY